MKKKFLALVLSFVMILSVLVAPKQLAHAESDFQLDESELVDQLPSHEAPQNPLFHQVRSSQDQDPRFGVREGPFEVNTDLSAFELQENRQYSSAPLPARFDLRNEGRVSPVKNQGPNGSCWAFATFGSAESVLLPREQRDFSEKHMRNTHGFDWGPDQGGNRAVSTAYLARWSGPVAEADEPYDYYGFQSPKVMPIQKHLKEVLYIPDATNTNLRNVLKKNIRQHGAAYTTINGNESYTNFRTMSHYNPGRGWANHAVTIVGWDDSYSRYNFNITPPGDGAWIIKNSWGNRWGSQGGYYYVSYYDAHAGRSNAIYVLGPKESNKSIWYYDDLGMTSSIGNGNTAWFSNVFGPTRESLDLTEVGFFVPSNNASYEIYVNTNMGSNSGFNQRVLVASGRAEFAGYQTVKINPQRIPQGASFAPMVKLTTPNYYYPIPIERPTSGYSSRARAGRGQSFISYDGRNWSDLTNQYSNTNVCLKAMTRPASGYTPSQNLVDSLSFDKTSLRLQPGQTEKIQARILPANASNKRLTWSSSNANVASVDQYGQVRANRAGSATITAVTNDGSNKRASCQVQVAEKVEPSILVQSISLHTSKTDLEVGATAYISANISPYNAKNKALSWTSSNPRIASVTNGQVKALNPGSVTITAQAQDGSGVSASIDLTIRKTDITSNPLNMTHRLSANPVTLGNRQVLTANVKDKYQRNMRYVIVTASLINPRGQQIQRSVYSDSYGNASFTFSPAELAQVGDYKINLVASGQGYDTSRAVISFTVKDSRPSFDFKVEKNKASIKATEEIGFTFTSNINRSRLSYTNFDFVIEGPNGFTHRNSGNTGYYGVIDYFYTPGVNAPAGTYTLKATARKNGYQDVLAQTSFKVEESAQAIKIDLEASQPSYLMGQRADVYIKLENNYDGRISYQPLKIQVRGPNNFQANLTKYTDRNGRSSVFIQPNASMVAGDYVVRVEYSAYGLRPVVSEYTVRFQNKEDKAMVLSGQLDKDQYQLGDRVRLSVDAMNENKRALSGVDVFMDLLDGQGKVLESKRLKTGYTGQVIWTPVQTIKEDKMSFQVRAQASGYKEENLKINIPVLGSSPSDDKIFKGISTDEAQAMIKEKGQDPSFVLFDVRTKAEFNESHIEGALHHDLYQADFDDYLKSLDPNKTYLIYCRTQVRSKETAEKLEALGFPKIYWMNGGMTQWLKEGKEAVFPETNKALEVSLTSSQSKHQAYQSLPINIHVSDLEGNNIRKANCQVEVLDANKRVVHNQQLNTDNYGKASFSFTPANQGPYQVRLVADFGSYERGHGLYMVHLNQEVSKLDFQASLKEGKFNHLDKSSLEYESLEKHYGKNILPYLVKDNQLKDHQIVDLIDPQKKTVLVFGYPGCGPCVDMWHAMAKLSHEDYNFLEIVTSVEEDPAQTVAFTDSVLREQGLESFRPHIYYDALDKIWADRLDFLTTPNTVFLDEQGRLVNIAGALDGQELKDIFNKTFSIDEPDSNDPLIMEYSLGQKQVEAGQSVETNLYIKDRQQRPMAQRNVRFTVTNPVGRVFVFNRMTDRMGKLYFPISTAPNGTLGTYKVVVEYTHGDYPVQKVEDSFTVVKKSTPIDPDPVEPVDPVVPPVDPDVPPIDPIEPDPDPQPPIVDQTKSFYDRDQNGEFNHIKSNDLYNKLKRVYGRNISSYSLTNLQGQQRRVSSIINPKKPTIVALGYPSCGGCQSSWRSFARMDLSSFTLIEAMTSGSANDIRYTLSRLGLSQLESHFYTGGQSIFQLVSSNYVPLLMYLDEDGNISNLSYFNSSSEVYQIIRQIEGTRSK